MDARHRLKPPLLGFGLIVDMPPFVVQVSLAMRPIVYQCGGMPAFVRAVIAS
jgi:hypothetical protein